MSDRDDDGYNSPEGKGSSEEEQRRKAALAQLTVDGGSDESGPPKPFDMSGLYFSKQVLVPALKN